MEAAIYFYFQKEAEKNNKQCPDYLCQNFDKDNQEDDLFEKVNH